ELGGVMKSLWSRARRRATRLTPGLEGLEGRALLSQTEMFHGTLADRGRLAVAAVADAADTVHALRQDCSGPLSEADVRGAISAPQKPGRRASRQRQAVYAVKLDRYNKN